MVSILELWLPILLSSVMVFILSSIIHMVLPYHRTDYKKLPSEDSLLDTLRKANIPPGDYMFPFCSDNKERNSQEYKDKLEKGPAGIVTIFPAGTNFMGSSLVMWFIYTVIVGIFAAYVAGRALPAGTDYLAVFRFAGVTSFVGYTLALLQDNIWYKKSWATTIKNVIDGLIYALFTGGIFGWLWPGITS
ncbi:MAG: hypothetical protein HXY49_04335 [Ignavibacteriaceae bacterium]|nr:hypothetical protein [Ignavibacteriaceae bacterium]